VRDVDGASFPKTIALASNIVKTGNTRTWYLPEHDNAASVPADELVFIMKADYGPAGQRVTDRYYKVRLLNETGELFDILRNHHYTVTVTDVTGPGYESEALALAGDVYVEAKVAEWNEVTGEVIFDGTHFLKVSRPRLDLFKETGWVDIELETDFPGLGDKSGNTPNDLPKGLIVEAGTDMTLNDTTDGSSTSVAAGNDLHLMKRIIHVVWSENTSGSAKTGIVFTVKAGNMTYVVEYSQSTEPWLTVPAITRVPTDGRFHTVEPTTTADWVATAAGGPIGTNAVYSLLQAQSLDMIELLASSSATSNDGKVHFRVKNLPMYYGMDDVVLTFNNDEYHYPSVTGSILFGQTAPSVSGRGVVPPLVGVKAPEGILAVNNLGRLNLDGQKYVGRPGTGITGNYIVYFKYGSLVGAAGAGAESDNFNSPGDVAWIPSKDHFGTQGFDVSPIDNSTISKWSVVPVSVTNIKGSTPNTSTGIGDPCMLAAKDNVEGGWRMPNGSITNVFAPIPGPGSNADAFGSATTESTTGVQGRYGTVDGHFYPFAGSRKSSNGTFRIDNSGVEGSYMSYTSVPIAQDYNAGGRYLSIKTNTVARNGEVYSNTIATSIRCVTTKYDDLVGAESLIQAPPGVIGIRHSDLVAFRAGTKTPADYSLTVKGSNRFAGETFADVAGGVEDEPVYMVYFKWGSQVAMLGEADGSDGLFDANDVVWWPTQSLTGVNYARPGSWTYTSFSQATPVAGGDGATFTINPTSGHDDPCMLVDGGNVTYPARWRTPSISGTTNPYSWTSTEMHSGTYTPFGTNYRPAGNLSVASAMTWSTARSTYGAKAGSVNNHLQGVLSDDGKIFLPYAGWRDSNATSNGTMQSMGRYGVYWTSAGKAYGLTTGAYSLGFGADNVHPSKDFWVQSSLPVRCVPYTPPVVIPPGITPPTEGFNASEGVLAVNNLGQLNLDGQTQIGTNGITSNKLVYFKYGSLIAVGGKNTTGDAFDSSDIAWRPAGFHTNDITAWSGIPYASGAETILTAPNESTGKGDPCMLAMKNGVRATGWRMPNANPYELVPVNTMGAETTVGGTSGRTDSAGRFYSYTGYRNNTGLLESSVGNRDGYYWANAGSGAVTVLLFSSGTVNNAQYGNRAWAIPIRCVEP
jgi:hypothetical protein